jgi:hypothetical protein
MFNGSCKSRGCLIGRPLGPRYDLSHSEPEWNLWLGVPTRQNGTWAKTGFSSEEPREICFWSMTAQFSVSTEKHSPFFTFNKEANKNATSQISATVFRLGYFGRTFDWFTLIKNPLSRHCRNVGGYPSLDKPRWRHSAHRAIVNRRQAFPKTSEPWWPLIFGSVPGQSTVHGFFRHVLQ